MPMPFSFLIDCDPAGSLDTLISDTVLRVIYRYCLIHTVLHPVRPGRSHRSSVRGLHSTVPSSFRYPMPSISSRLSPMHIIWTLSPIHHRLRRPRAETHPSSLRWASREHSSSSLFCKGQPLTPYTSTLVSSVCFLIYSSLHSLHYVTCSHFLIHRF